MQSGRRRCWGHSSPSSLWAPPPPPPRPSTFASPAERTSARSKGYFCSTVWPSATRSRSSCTLRLSDDAELTNSYVGRTARRVLGNSGGHMAIRMRSSTRTTSPMTASREMKMAGATTTGSPWAAATCLCKLTAPVCQNGPNNAPCSRRHRRERVHGCKMGWCAMRRRRPVLTRRPRVMKGQTRKCASVGNGIVGRRRRCAIAQIMRFACSDGRCGRHDLQDHGRLCAEHGGLRLWYDAVPQHHHGRPNVRIQHL